MILKKCAFCQKDIPGLISVCPYCNRDKSGRDSRQPANGAETSDPQIQTDIKGLSSEDPLLRKNASDRLFQKGPAVVAPLVTHLTQSSFRRVGDAVSVLGRLRDRRAVDVLVQAMKTGDETVRVAAVCALGQINDPRALEELVRESERNDPAIQSYLAFIIAGYQDSRVVPALIRLSRHANRDVAFQAIWGLGQAGDKKSIVSLRRVLNRRDPLLKAAAVSSLRRLGGPVRRVFPVWGYAMVGLGISLGVGLMYFYR
jgi:HEAT repeat protein